MAEIRVAVAADAMEIAQVHVRSWQRGYRGLLPEDYLNGLRPEDRAARYNFDDHAPGGAVSVVALEMGTICGFAVSGPARDDDATDQGEVLALYVDPNYWRRGIGRLLMKDARARLRTRGFAEAVLWALAGNDRGQAFYRADGWTPDGNTRTDEIWGARVDELRYRRVIT
jgi:GNAT superfamily N-acetyltransferase